MRTLLSSTCLQHFEILDYFLEQVILTNRKTLKGDIDLMVECGMNIVTLQSKPNRYFEMNEDLRQRRGDAYHA